MIGLRQTLPERYLRNMKKIDILAKKKSKKNLLLTPLLEHHFTRVKTVEGDSYNDLEQGVQYDSSVVVKGQKISVTDVDGSITKKAQELEIETARKVCCGGKVTLTFDLFIGGE